MKRVLSILIICLITGNLSAQQNQRIENPSVSQGVLVKVTEALSAFTPDPSWIDEKVRDENGLIKGRLNFENRAHNRSMNPNAQPKGEDPIRQLDVPTKKTRNIATIQNYDGLGFTNVSPADPSICVGPNHVIQMINAGSGARFIIYDKNGTTVQASQYMDAISGISGAGDPIAMYDQFANRYVITEFGNNGNRLIMMVSQTSNPTGSWYVYQFNTPQFPDYPKFGIWPDAFVCTTNESNNKVYAMDRIAMLAGSPTTTLISFSIPNSPSVGFQAATPVNLVGTNLPPAGTEPIVMRMTDDAWGNNLNDELQLWYLDLDFNNPASSTLTQQTSLPTAAFSSHLCGYTTFNCIDQPNTNQGLDPLREVLMNRIYLRSFPTHQSMVLAHAVDASGNDDAGVRWYELRRFGLGAWSIYQQGTYAPDNVSRWMPTISMDQFGNIGMMYNTSSNSVFPSLRLTGRLNGDPLGQMTQTEQVVIAGSASHTNSRWGDYNDMGICPNDDATFWATGMYKPSSNGWDTRIASFNFINATLQISQLDFEAYEEESIRLEWKAQEEENMQVYHLERSTTADFTGAEIVHSVMAKNLEEADYKFVDENLPMVRNLYYRLKYYNQSGSFKYSKVKSIFRGSETVAELYPNPVLKDEFYIRLNDNLRLENVEIRVWSSCGENLSTRRASSYVESFQTEGWGPGLFVVQLLENGQLRSTQKVMVY